MQDDAADDLHGEVFHPQHAPRGLAAGGKGIRQDIVERLSVCEPRFQRRSHCLQLLIRFGGILFLQSEDLVPQGKDAFDFFSGIIAKQFFQKSHFTSLLSMVLEKPQL